jgi:hypothetical protein
LGDSDVEDLHDQAFDFLVGCVLAVEVVEEGAYFFGGFSLDEIQDVGFGFVIFLTKLAVFGEEDVETGGVFALELAHFKEGAHAFE